MLILLLAGAGGGLVRGLVGFIKHQFAYKSVEFKPLYFSSVMALSAIIGLTVTWAIVGSGISFSFVEQVNTPIAFIIGYAGGDFIENLYKILVKKYTIYPIPEE